MISTTLIKKPLSPDPTRSKETSSRRFLFVKQDQEGHPQPNTISNLREAKSFITRMRLSELPDLIILDMPLDLKELTTFRNWMSQNLIPPIPMVYKETYLTRSEIKNIFKLNLVDDVIKNDSDRTSLQEKIRFFKSLTAQSLIDPTFAKRTGKISKPLWRKFIKKTMDIFMSLSLLIVLSPLLLVIALLIKLTSKGPVLYTSKRAGQGFKVFNFYKFRTMVASAEDMLPSLQEKNAYSSSNGDPCFFKVPNDPRVTKIGQFLRNTSLDELPQLLNVLKGEMSLVGNRPLPLYEAATLTTAEWAERFMAPAGMTGLWQISKRGKSDMSAEERISLDIMYARNRSTRRDLRILLTTPMALIQKQSQ